MALVLPLACGLKHVARFAGKHPQRPSIRPDIFVLPR